jgi:hypothetical protein
MQAKPLCRAAQATGQFGRRQLRRSLGQELENGSGIDSLIMHAVATVRLQDSWENLEIAGTYSLMIDDSQPDVRKM